MSKPHPSPNRDNGPAAGKAGAAPKAKGGRDTSGRFAPGNAGGPGNPHARHIGQLRSAMLAAVTPADVQAIVARMVKLAKAGELPAMREVLDRTLGRPVEADLIERLEALERMAAEVASKGGTP